MSLNEWQFLAADADRVNFTTPLPQYLRFTLPDTAEQAVSALQFSRLTPANSDVKTLSAEGTAQTPIPVAPEVVLLHGAGLNAHSFDPFTLALFNSAPELHTVTALDLPGHGNSAWRKDANYSPAALSAQLAEPLAAHIQKPAVFIGHSLGGLTAALLVAANPGFCKHLVIVDITPDSVQQGASKQVAEFITGKREFNSLDEMLERALEFGIGSDIAALKRGITLNSRQRTDGKFEWAHHFAHLDGLMSASGDPQIMAESGWQALKQVAAANIPVTLIAARSGMVTSDNSAEWKQQLPESQVLTIDGPHNLHEAAPSKLAAAIAGALEDAA